MYRIKILIVEDDPHFGTALYNVMEEAGCHAILAKSGAEALQVIVRESFDLVLQDLKLPDANGLDILREILKHQPFCGSLVMTGYGTIESAVEAMKMGAFDFLTKPFPMELLFNKLEIFLEFRKLQKDVATNNNGQAISSSIKSRNPAMLSAIKSAEHVAVTDASILLLGESGTGKDLIAKAIHDASHRLQGPFITVNCAAIPRTLLESELFGVEKGAYTGADRSRPGYFEMASGGTLYLDEVGELPLELQGKLLRVLEERTVARVGGTSPMRLNFRLISATNRDIADLVVRQEFRKDLFYRINVVTINLPPLRERKEDIPLLLAHFLDRFVSSSPGKKAQFTPDALELLCEYQYPGNIRELRNIVERVALLFPGKKIRKQHLPAEIQKPGPLGSTFESFTIGKPLKEAISEYEKRYIEKVIDHTGGRKILAAEILGLSRKGLWEKLKNK